MRILGIQYESHDTGVAVIEDGKILYAANEERFSRKKMDDAMPLKSLASALDFLQLDYKDFDVLAFSGNRPGLKKIAWHFWQQNQRVWYTRLGYLRSFLNPLAFDAGRFARQSGISGLVNAFKINRGIRQIENMFREKGFRGRVEFVEHDLCHAASAYYTSGFDDAFVAIYEGSSLFNTCSFWQGKHGKLKKVGDVPLPHSPGRYYEVVTRILGFHPKKHGGKITGLAAFGNPAKCYDRVKTLLWCEGTQIRVGRKLFSLADEYYRRGKKLPQMFAGESREDIAAAFQKRLEDVICEQLKNFVKKYNLENLALAGGVVANVKLNMEIMNLAEVQNLFIHPGMGDVGQALGAALEAQARVNPDFRPFKLGHVYPAPFPKTPQRALGMRDQNSLSAGFKTPSERCGIYLGPDFSDEQILKALENSNLKYEKPSDLADRTAELLKNNKVIGLFQGRMEYGPRALGNRSILYPAVDRTVNDWLNKQLKRTEFMPFAPVTLAERAGDCYIGLEKTWNSAEFMTITLPVTDYMREKMPAAVHVDGTARPQLIKRETNPLYYDILKKYESLTGLPSLVNTSFNMHEEPIVCTPEEAISAFQQSKLDYLVIGNYLAQI